MVVIYGESNSGKSTKAIKLLDPSKKSKETSPDAYFEYIDAKEVAEFKAKAAAFKAKGPKKSDDQDF